MASLKPASTTPLGRPFPIWIRTLTAGQLAVLVVIFAIFVIEAYPFFYILSLAVMPYNNYVREAIHAWPSGFSLQYFQSIFADSALVSSFEISVLKTIVGTTLNVVATTMAGYALSRPGLKLRRPLTLLFLIPLFLNAGIIPFFLVIRTLGLLNTFWALVLPNMVAPFFLFMARAQFAAYPQEVIEAAHVDGAGHFGIFWRIVWPTSLPIISTLTLLYGISQWNEYFWPSFLVQSNLYPAAVTLYNFITSANVLSSFGLGQQMPPQSLFAAMAAIMIIPVLIVYPILQRFLIKGLLIGAIKG